MCQQPVLAVHAMGVDRTLLVEYDVARNIVKGESFAKDVRIRLGLFARKYQIYTPIRWNDTVPRCLLPMTPSRSSDGALLECGSRGHACMAG